MCGHTLTEHERQQLRRIASTEKHLAMALACVVAVICLLPFLIGLVGGSRTKQSLPTHNPKEMYGDHSEKELERTEFNRGESKQIRKRLEEEGQPGSPSDVE